MRFSFILRKGRDHLSNRAETESQKSYLYTRLERFHKLFKNWKTEILNGSNIYRNNSVLWKILIQWPFSNPGMLPAYHQGIAWQLPC